MTKSKQQQPGALMGPIIACLLVILLPDQSRAATVNEPETWDAGDTAGWKSYDLINETVTSALTVDDGTLKLTFRKQSMKLPPEEHLIKADDSTSGGRFAGNYLSNGVMRISFRLYCEYQVAVRVELYNEKTGRLWRYRVPNIRVGEWMSVNVLVDPAMLRNVNGARGFLAFEEDLQNVSWVGVTIQRNSSMKAQTYLIDDFALTGAGPDFAAWMEQFVPSGSVEENKLPERDLDRDGMDNYGEWIAGTSAGDVHDCLAIRLGSKEGETGPDAELPGIVLRWPSTTGRKYRVLRSTNLMEEFKQIGPELEATPPENTFKDLTATGKTPYFYKVTVTEGQ